MGDKTQIATIAMAARFDQVLLVVAGTTLGMLIADVPAVFLGERFSRRIPLRLVHGIAALMFAAMGVATLAGLGDKFGLQGQALTAPRTLPAWARDGPAVPPPGALQHHRVVLQPAADRAFGYR